MLEIGFGQGHSVALWETLFPNADITWIDYSAPPSPAERGRCVPGADVVCAAGERSRFLFGDQANATFLREVVAAARTAATSDPTITWQPEKFTSKKSSIFTSKRRGTCMKRCPLSPGAEKTYARGGSLFVARNYKCPNGAWGKGYEYTMRAQVVKERV
jgi:hypothetical protein